ncbi:hypothetical protein Pint_10313 [Pistacia integerrima]|uniref:Uncharacterized protein n=1 Tax=Pistacia integerrima TaxID=434235 RepID=A0ACC0XKX3_9ROSI|nr:hypothetical protein Pint_10313 [Pistacia integerrima]
MLFLKRLLPLSVLALSYSWTQLLLAATLPQDEVDVLNQIAQTMGARNWTFNADVCEGSFDVNQVLLTDPLRNITCDCQFVNSTCHIVSIQFMRYSLPGTLPPQLVQLPYLQEIDFAYNYLNGTIPHEWATMQLKYISIFGNRLSGNIPDQLGNITSLTYLDLEANQFSGEVPAVLGKLVNLETLRLSSNRLSGNLPMELAELKNLTDFRISDNNFNGSIPEFIQNWKQLQRLEIQGSGLEGPIPPSISVLEKLNHLRISDIKSTNQTFPELRNMTSFGRIILRNCSISGEIPEYIWGMNLLRILDLSFNKLTGELPSVPISATLKFIFLTGNFLSGNIPESILRKGTNVDLSYNNFTQLSPGQPACQDRRDLSLNLFRSSSMKSNLSEVQPCRNDFKCDRYWHSFHVNCGGNDVKVNGTTFEGDAAVAGGVATYYFNENSNWGFSSTGDFTDDDDEQNTYYIENSNSSQISALYSDARKSPLSLTYFGYCLANGNYDVILHFAEVKFTKDNTYSSLGRRIFDIYVQNKLVKKDFNIAAEASGVLIPVTVPDNATVTNNILEIRFNWAGRGTTAVPVGGVYGPLVSAISVVDPNFRPKKKDIVPIVVGVVLGLCLIILALGILCWRYYFRTKRSKEGVMKHTLEYVMVPSTCEAFHLQQSGKLMELVDQKLGSEFNEVEAERMIRVALICTNASPSLRPIMSEVVSMLEGTSTIPDAVPLSGRNNEDLRFKTLRDHHKQVNQDLARSQAHYPTSNSSFFGSSSADDVCEINEESYLRFKAIRDSHIQTSSSKSVQDMRTV